MKKILSTLLVAVLAFTASQAQNPQRKMHRKHPGQHQNATRQLNFSEEQNKKYKELKENFRKNLMDLRKQDEITVKEWKTKMADLHQKHRTDMQSLLTQEQKSRIEKIKAERKQMAMIDANARMEKMKIQLGLSHEQTSKMNSQQKAMMEKMKALHENKSMDMLKKREEIKALMEKRKENMKSILTEEQMKKMEEMKMRHPQMKMHHPQKPGKLS